MSFSVVNTYYDQLGYRAIDGGRPPTGVASGATLNRLLVPLMAVVIVLIEKLMTSRPSTRSEPGPDGEPRPAEDAASASDYANPQCVVKEVLQLLSTML